MKFVTPDLRLASQPQDIAAVQLVQLGDRDMCVNNLPRSLLNRGLSCLESQIHCLYHYMYTN